MRFCSASGGSGNASIKANYAIWKQASKSKMETSPSLTQPQGSGLGKSHIRFSYDRRSTDPL